MQKTVIINAETNEVSYSYTEQVQEPEITINYDDEVVRLIRLKYDISRELKMINEQFSNPEQYSEYRNYVEDCKQQVREMLEKC